MKCEFIVNRSGVLICSFTGTSFRLAEVVVEAAFGGIYITPIAEEYRFPTLAEMQAIAACQEVGGNQFVNPRSTWDKIEKIQQAAKDYRATRDAFAGIQKYKSEMAEKYPRIQH